MSTKSNTNASASLFGWDFQINAAIVLFLEHIKEMTEVRVEGSTEDIELTLYNGKKIYAQAKSVVDLTKSTSMDQKLKKSLTTLHEASLKGDFEKLIYITNSPNPFNNQKTMSSFVGFTRKSHVELPPVCQLKIDKFCKEMKLEFQNDHFFTYVLPFEDTNPLDKYKVIKQLVDDFVNYFEALHGKGKDYLTILQHDFFQNATRSNTEICISKKSIIWPLVVIATEQISAKEINTLDEEDYDDIKVKYKTLIDNAVERFEFTTKVVSDYNFFKNQNNTKSLDDFICEYWKLYLDEFSGEGCDLALEKKVIEIIIKSIIAKRRFINDIRKEVNL